MSAYDALAFSYDALTYDVDYEKNICFWQKLLTRFRARPESVLDLACGTGSASVLLAERGYRVLGVDCSEQMLTVAAEKASCLENPPYFIKQKMQRLRLPEPVDAVLCGLDSINYITNPKDCREAFRRVWQALTPGGLFVFDINTPYKLRGLDGQVFLDEDEDTYCVWRAEFSEKRRICHYGIDLFQRDEDDSWLRSTEEHLEYAYTPQELEAYLYEAGFKTVRQYGDRVLRAPKEDELRIWFAAKKE